MPYFCLEKIERALNDDARAVRGAKVLILGVAYKGGVGDTRESPALKIIEALRERGAEISYHDPYVPALTAFGLTAIEDLDAAVADTDVAVIVTAHPGIDFHAIARSAKTVDLRGVTRAAVVSAA
jgi:UDP-N-acetyl-D-glucosamine dehydrogenase